MRACLLLCIPFSLALDAYAQNADDVSNQELNAEAIAATEAFIEDRTEGDLDANWNQFTPRAQELFPLEDYKRITEQAGEQLGPLSGFRVTTVTPYPENDAIAVNFMAAYGPGKGECGYLIWVRGDDQLRLGRIERNGFDLNILQSPDAPERLRQFGCRVGGE